jgi:hypothetical protein
MYRPVAFMLFSIVASLNAEPTRTPEADGIQKPIDYQRCTDSWDAIIGLLAPPASRYDAHWFPTQNGFDTEAQRRRAMIQSIRPMHTNTEGRVIVNRRRDAKTPTWDGNVPATVVDPLIWYFDPLKAIPAANVMALWIPSSPGLGQIAPPEPDLAARRTLLESLLEPSPLPRPPSYDKIMLFR